MYTKWWKEKSGGACNEDESKKSKNANALGVTNVGGVFVVLIGGMFAGFLIALLEFLWKSWKNARVDKVRNMSCDMKKPVFPVSDKARYKPVF